MVWLEYFPLEGFFFKGVKFVNPGLEVTKVSGPLVLVLDCGFLFVTFLFLGVEFVGLKAI